MTTTTFDRAGLLKLCSQVRPALAASPYIPALVHIQFDGEYAMTFNDVMAISVQCEPGFKACVPGELMIKTLGSFRGDRVAMTLGDAKLLLACERSKINLPWMPVDKMPFEIPAATGLEVPLTADLIWGIKQCLLGVGTDERLPARMGVTLEATRSGKALLFSTDGVTISMSTTKASLELPGGVPVIMPTAFCENVVALQHAYPEVVQPMLELLPGALLASFSNKAMIFTKTVADVEPLDFNQVLRKHFDPDKANYTPVPEGLDDALQRAFLVCNPDKPGVDFETQGGKLYVRARSAAGESEDIFDWVGQIKPVECNPQLIVRGLKQTNKIMFADTLVTVLSNDDSSFVHCIANFAKRK